VADVVGARTASLPVTEATLILGTYVQGHDPTPDAGRHEAGRAAAERQALPLDVEDRRRLLERIALVVRITVLQRASAAISFFLSHQASTKQTATPAAAMLRGRSSARTTGSRRSGWGSPGEARCV
jgi:hypothetical protein